MRDITGIYTAVYARPLLQPQSCDDAGLIVMVSPARRATLDALVRPPHLPHGAMRRWQWWGRGNLWIVCSAEAYYQNDAQATTGGLWCEPDYGLVGAFCDAVATDAPMPITGHDGPRALEVALAAYQSAALGEVVTLPL